MRTPHGVLKADGAALAERKRFRRVDRSGSAPAHRRHGGDGALYVYLRKRQMKQAFHTIRVSTHGPGLYEFTDEVADFVRAEKIGDGLLTCFIRHTSASLLIQENADPDVQKDLQDFFAQSGEERAWLIATPPKGRTTCRRISVRR